MFHLPVVIHFGIGLGEFVKLLEAENPKCNLGIKKF